MAWPSVVGTWLLAAFVAQGLPNPLVSYIDDLAVRRTFSVPFLYAPLLVWLLARVALHPRRGALALVALAGALSVHGLLCLLTTAFVHAQFGDATLAPSRRDGGPETLEDAWVEREGREVRDESRGLPPGLRLTRASYTMGGSGSNWVEVLYSTRRTAAGTEVVVDGVDIGYSGNHPTWSEVDWILPLSVTPFARSQYWIRRVQDPLQCVLFEVAQDGRFVYRSPLWAALPFGASLVPLVVLLLPLGAAPRRELAAWALLLLWCLLFSPWAGWGL